MPSHIKVNGVPAPFQRSLLHTLGVKPFSLDASFHAAAIHLDEVTSTLSTIATSTTEPCMIGCQRDLWDAFGIEWDFKDDSKAGYAIRTAAVIAVTNADGSILLTRRASTLRTFPRCWVLPGGMVEEGESLREAAVRELFEETGLVVEASTLKLVAAWESSYPVFSHQCKEIGGLISHVLMVCFTAPMKGGELRLQEGETDAAIWLGLDAISDLFSGAEDEDRPAVNLADGSAAFPKLQVPLNRLFGVYPNAAGEGIGLGHYFVLKRLISAKNE